MDEAVKDDAIVAGEAEVTETPVEIEEAPAPEEEGAETPAE